MARRNAKDTVDTEQAAPESSNTEQNGQVEPEQHPSETPGEQAVDQSSEPKASTEPDLTGFKAAIEKALEDMDVSSGSLPLAATDGVGTEYRKLEGQKAKNAAKTHVEDSIRDAIAGDDPSMQRARAYVEIRNALAVATASKGGSAPKEPVDPTTGYANRLASLQLASLIVGNDVPDGVDTEKANTEAADLVSSLGEQVEQYLTWQRSDAEDKGDAPEVSPIVKAAFKLATGKATGSVRASGSTGPSYSGPRRDIVKHIGEYLADKEDGSFHKISEVAKFQSSEYPDGSASQGAITARLFDKEGAARTFDGFVGVQPEGGNPKGVRKLAA